MGQPSFLFDLCTNPILPSCNVQHMRVLCSIIGISFSNTTKMVGLDSQVQ